MNSVLRKIAESIIPASRLLPIRFAWLKAKGKLDGEMLHVGSLLKNRRRFIDVGANAGIYSYFFAKDFEKVEAFEPIQEITRHISNLSQKNICIHDVALSNSQGELLFYIPSRNGVLITGLASLEPRDGPCEKRTVEVKTIDSYEFSSVDLIKIDVEGHEYNVLDGARDTLARCKPVVLAEIEQRHIQMPIEKVFDVVLDQGYDGFFLVDGKMTPLENFSFKVNQEPYLDDVTNDLYINNFIFVPK